MKEIKVEDWKENPFKVVGKDWMLVTAEKDGKTNMMTASWGGVGIMWGKNVVTIYIRPSRYTKTFLDSGDKFSISVLPESFREQLAYCGKISGRDEDKVAACGLNVEKKDGTVYFKEARLVMICKKLYSQPMDSERLLDSSSKNTFWKNDIHEMYIAEIETLLVE